LEAKWKTGAKSNDAKRLYMLHACIQTEHSKENPQLSIRAEYNICNQIIMSIQWNDYYIYN